MAHFAKVVDGKVSQVIVAEPEFFLTFKDTSPGDWIQTSINTSHGVHRLGGTPLRKNFASVGHSYDSVLDAFIITSRIRPICHQQEVAFLKCCRSVAGCQRKVSCCHVVGFNRQTPCRNSGRNSEKRRTVGRTFERDRL